MNSNHPPQPLDEKAKPFRLVKYFTFSSLLVLFLGTIALSLLNTHWLKSMQRKKSEEFAHLLVENLNHQIFLQFLVPVGLIYGKVQLSDQRQYGRMDRVVRATLHSFKVKTVHIYDVEYTISYSFDNDRIGKKQPSSFGYEEALKGRTTSQLIQKGGRLELLLGVPQESLMVTFAPLRAEKPMAPPTGPILGVLEIVQDLSDDHQTIFRAQIFILASSTVVMGVLFLIMLLVVNRGEGIIKRRADERLRLEEELNRSRHLSTLGKMVAAVSHEIRNPLGIIRSSAELLKKKLAPDQPAAGPIAQIIVEESSRLNNIITDFLNFARPLAPNLRSCQITDILEKNLTFLAPQLESQHYRIIKNIQDRLPAIHADADMLYQAILNLLLNAMQAMPDGGQIEITVKTLEEPKRLQLSIADNGPGVEQSLMDKLWTPFFTTKDKGTGLGLGIVKNIIEAHRGEIRITNRLSSGARVELDLPLDDADPTGAKGNGSTIRENHTDRR